MPVQVEFFTQRDGGGPRLALFCDGVETSDDPPMVQTGSGGTPKALPPNTAVLYGLDAVALGELDWQPRFVCYPDAGSRPHVEEIGWLELDVTRSVVTVALQRG